jgi:hypothetical protein
VPGIGAMTTGMALSPSGQATPAPSVDQNIPKDVRRIPTMNFSSCISASLSATRVSKIVARDVPYRFSETCQRFCCSDLGVQMTDVMSPSF